MRSACPTRRFLIATLPRGCPQAGSTRYPLGLWTAENKSSSFLRILQKWLPGEEDSEPVDIVAVHSTFPYVAGLVPEEYLEQTETRSMLTSFSAAEGKTEIPDYSTLEKSFLHLAYESDEPHLFETPLGQAVLLFKWEAYGKRVLLAQAMVYLLQLCSVCMQVEQRPLCDRAECCPVPQSRQSV